MKIQAVCVGAPERLPGRKAKTGIFKHPVSGPVIVDAFGLAGDAVLNHRHHGGPDQALLVESAETLDWWAKTLGREMKPGTLGENLVIDGLDAETVAVGDRFAAGNVLLEATGPRIPCSVLASRMEDPHFARRFLKAGRPGIYVRVLAPGLLEPGLAVTFEPYPGERVSLVDLMRALVEKPGPAERTRMLAAPLGERVRRSLGG